MIRANPLLRLTRPCSALTLRPTPSITPLLPTLYQNAHTPHPRAYTKSTSLPPKREIDPHYRESLGGGEQRPSEVHALTSQPPARFKRTLPSFSLEGSVAVVTGGARGLGLVMSRALLIGGAEVAIVDLNGGLNEAQDSAAELIRDLKEERPDIEPPKISTHFADVSQPDSVNKAMTAILATHGKVDSLVTSAGFTENFPAEEYPHDRMQKLWRVNVDGTYIFAVAVAKHLMERQAGGSLIFIGSMSGAIVNKPQPQAPYNAAKAAVRHLASSLAVEWADRGIRVNCISPGYMLTALTKKIISEKPELYSQWLSMIPQGRMGNPEDLMGAVTFLASDASAYITGADLRVDGGYTLT